MAYNSLVWFCLLFTWLAAAPAANPYSWPHTSLRPLSEAIPTPAGFRRVPADQGSFALWLRNLPVRPDGTPVRLFDGSQKGNQAAHEAVLDVDVGQRDHQQCADAVMRLRAEYLFAAGREPEVCFRATNGAALPWSAWKSGQRPHLSGKRIEWRRQGHGDGSWPDFRKYLDFVFVYAGTWSLQRQLIPVKDIAQIQAGDVFIQGGFPGHAVVVVDVAQDDQGQRVFLLAQSYMPAQDIHVLKNPGSNSPWYPARSGKLLVTPEWVFQPPRLMRFSDGGGCQGVSEAAREQNRKDRAVRDDTRSASYRSGTSDRPR
jgi:hypothetical protein